MDPVLQNAIYFWKDHDDSKYCPVLQQLAELFLGMLHLKGTSLLTLTPPYMSPSWYERQKTQASFILKGAIHKVRHDIFGQFLPPPSVTLCHTSRDPPKVRHTSRSDLPPILVGSTKNLDKNLCTNSLSIVRGVFVRRF